MSRSNFEALAKYLNEKELGKYCQVIQGMVSIKDLQEHLANYCRAQNPSFNKQKFIEACK